MSEVALPAVHIIEAEFYSKRSTKAFQLVNNSASLTLDAKRQWYNYDFAQPVYILELSVAASGYESWNEIDFEVDHIDGTKNQQSVKVGSGVAVVKVGKLSSGFRFRPLEKVLSTPKLQKVSAVGYTLEEFHSFEWTLKEYEKKSEEIDARELKVLSAEEGDKLKAEQRAALDSEIGKSKAEAEELASQTAARQATISALNALKSKLDDDLSELETRRSTVRKDVSSSEVALQTLKNEIRLFPSEIAGFVTEGNRSIKWYISMATPFVCVIALVLYTLLSGAVDLTQLWKQEKDVSIWVVFLTRLPFVLIALALLEVCGHVVGRLFAEVMRINRQRLSLSKLSIVARDVSVAAAYNTDLNMDQIYENEVKLKMELLRGHMTEDLGAEFHYGGTFIQGIAAALEHFSVCLNLEGFP